MTETGTRPSGGETTETRTKLEGDACRSGTRPSRRRQVFASVFTPTWSLSLLILLCLFLPSYQGCNGNTIYPYRIFGELESDATSLCQVFLLTWPYFFALIVAVGTVRLAAGRELRGSAMLWWGQAILIVANAVLLVLALLRSDHGDKSIWSQILEGWWFVLPSAGLLVWLPLSRRCCRDVYGAAQSVQVCLALLAVPAFSFSIPLMMFAGDFLIGGQIAVGASALLVISTVIQQIDGRRALLRSRWESPVQLTLKTMMLLMLLGGVACSWTGVVCFVDAKQESGKPVVVAPDSSTVKSPNVERLE